MNSDYTTKLVKLADEANAAHREAQASYRSGVAHAERAGKALIKAKSLVSHGEWGIWLAKNFEGSERLAQLYMRMARHLLQFDDEQRSNVAEMSLREADVALSKPRTQSMVLQITNTPVKARAVKVVYSNHESVWTNQGPAAVRTVWDPAISSLVKLSTQARSSRPDDVAKALAAAGSVDAADLERLATWLADVAVSLHRQGQNRNALRI